MRIVPAILLVCASLPAAWAASPMDGPAGAQDRPAPRREPDPLFRSHEPVTVSLRGPFRAISRDHADEPAEQEGSLTLEGAEQQTFDVQIRARGKSRRDKQACRFPPLRVNFKTSQLDGSVFEHQDKLKLVTHCSLLGDTSPRYEGYQRLEYLAYRIFNIITNNSFMVRPVQVRYIVSDDEDRVFEHPGFFIEDKDRLGKRLGLKLAEPDEITRFDLEPEAATLAEYFQYMVGNTDFSFLQGPAGDHCCHNGVLFALGNLYVPVPYDLDATGLVNPPYATPAPEFRLPSVRKRRYRGFCRDPDLMSSARQRYLDAWPEIQALFEGDPELDRGVRRSALRYLDGFHDALSSNKQFERQIMGRCR